MSDGKIIANLHSCRTLDFGIANTIEDLGHRIAPRPQIYVKSEASVLGMANAMGEAGLRVAQGAQITGKMDSASHRRFGSLRTRI